MFLQADPWKFDLWENTQADSWLSSLQMSEGSIQKFFEQETYLFYNQLSENKCLSSTTIFNVWLAWSVLYKWLQPQSYNDCTEKPGTVKDSEVLRRAIAKKQKQMSGTALRKEKSEGRKFTLNMRIWGTALPFKWLFLNFLKTLNISIIFFTKGSESTQQISTSLSSIWLGWGDKNWTKERANTKGQAVTQVMPEDLKCWLHSHRMLTIHP